MLNRIVLKLECEEDFKLHTNMSSLFHGFLMRNISSDYAQKMHISGLRPFSQALLKENDSYLWQISTLNDEAYENIIEIIKKFKSVYIEDKKQEIALSQVDFKTTSFEELFEKNYFSSEPSSFVKLGFLNPTAFKMAGRYVYMPDASLILSGLVKRFDAFSEKIKIEDEQLVDEISQKVFIRDFRIFSRYFSVDGSKIPGFCGDLTLKVAGSQTLVKLVNMLADFSEYSGVGIKTALGMGSVVHKLTDRGGQKHG